MVLVVVIAAVAVLSLTIVRALLAFAPAKVETVTVRGPELLAVADTDTLDVLCWNIGYAGLGRGADFIADGGRHLRPHSHTQIEENLAAIRERLLAADADILLLQELARDSYLTRGVDVLGTLQADLVDHQMTFTPTVQVTDLPILGSLIVGKATSSRYAMAVAERRALATARRMGVTVQHFNALSVRLAVKERDWQWVLLNVHLAAFDDGNLRQSQLKALLTWMQAEYKAGNRIVAGGDWNMRLAETDFAHTADPKHQFWVRDLPENLVPADWSWGVDSSVPTSRTLERPYSPGVNYTCVIDGFLVSPNVEIVAVQTVDLGFEHSDHNPVSIRIRSR